MSEVEFWIHDVAAKEGIYHRDYLKRLSNSTREFVCERVRGMVKENAVVIDAGCGLCSQYGRKLGNGKIELIPLDPLAYFYNAINMRYCGNSDVKINFGLFEFLSHFLGTDYADIIIIDNALDHCIDPWKSIQEAILTVKVGGIVSLKHRRCEAVHEGYGGLHKWNMDIDNNNDFIIWNKTNKINVSEMLKNIAKVELCLRACENKDGESIEVNIEKMKMVDSELFYTYKEENYKLTKTIEMLMKYIADENRNMEFQKMMKIISADKSRK